jgi:hypothetical protein
MKYSEVRVKYEWSSNEVRWSTNEVRMKYALLKSRFLPLGYYSSSASYNGKLSHYNKSIYYFFVPDIQLRKKWVDRKW